MTRLNIALNWGAKPSYNKNISSLTKMVEYLSHVYIYNLYRENYDYVRGCVTVILDGTTLIGRSYVSVAFGVPVKIPINTSLNINKSHSILFTLTWD